MVSDMGSTRKNIKLRGRSIFTERRGLEIGDGVMTFLTKSGKGAMTFFTYKLTGP